jgi:hypothetical protein
MTTIPSTPESTNKHSFLRRARNWIDAFTEAMDHDPHQHHYDSIRVMRQEVRNLELRLADLERTRKTAA